MKIIEVLITTNIINYYVIYKYRDNKLVQYIAEFHSCTNRIIIYKYEYKCTNSKRVKIIKSWYPYDFPFYLKKEV